jgi:hypothetical protein
MTGATPPRVDGDRREEQAAAVGSLLATIYARCEQAILAAITAAVQAAVPLGAVTMGALGRLRRIAAVALGAAEQEAEQTLADAGIPWDYQPTVPGSDLGEGGADLGQVGSGPDLAAVTGGESWPSLSDLYQAVAARVYRETPDIFQTAVIDGVADMRGGLPTLPNSLPRIEAAQHALDTLTENGITGFTDRAGRNWDLLSYVEMATRTAVSNMYDNVQNAAILAGGHDLIWTLTDSTEGSCPLCIPWLGRVLSLTGRTTGLVSISDAGGRLVQVNVAGTLNEARAAGFRHPNCRCSWILFVDGADLTAVEPSAELLEMYQASQRQRALERHVRAAGRRASTAMTPEARKQARRDLAAARAASAAHRAANGNRIGRNAARRREHPWNAH